MKKFIVACVLTLSFVSTSFASYDIGLMTKYYDLTRGAYYELFDIWFISKEDRDILVNDAYHNIYDLGNNPEETYSLAVEYFNKQQTIHHQISKDASVHYGRIKEIYDKLLALWYITSEMRESLGINAHKSIYNESGVAQNDGSKEYNIALDYEKKQWEIQNNKLNKDYNYGITIDIYYKLFTRWLITQSELDRQKSTAWDYIYNGNSVPEKIYNTALEYERYMLNNVNTSTSISPTATNNTVTNKINTYNSTDTSPTATNNTVTNNNINTYSSSLPQNTQDIITRKINSLDSSRRGQWTSGVIDKIDVLLTKKSWSTKNRNTLLAIQQFLQDYLEQNSSELDIDNLLN